MDNRVAAAGKGKGPGGHRGGLDRAALTIELLLRSRPGRASKGWGLDRACPASATRQARKSKTRRRVCMRRQRGPGLPTPCPPVTLCHAVDAAESRPTHLFLS